MHNKTGFNRLGLRAGHRRALLRNMVISLFQHEQIVTTKAKAKEVCRHAEKAITRARVDSVHNRRIIARDVHDADILKKLFSELAPRYQERHGGYTRIVKLGQRQGDAADLVVLELVDRAGGFDQATPTSKKSAKKGPDASKKPAAPRKKSLPGEAPKKGAKRGPVAEKPAVHHETHRSS